MDWSEHEAVIARWRDQTYEYVAAVNAFVERGTRDGWDEAGPEPEDPRTSEQGAAIAEIVRRANEAGAWREIRERVPPAHAPFIPTLEERSVSFRSVHWVDESRVVAALGDSWEPETVMVFGLDGEAEHVSTGAIDVGASPDRRFFGLLSERTIEVREGWEGEVVARCPCPRGDEDVPEGVETLDDDSDLATVESLTVLPDGSGVVLATSCGIFLTRPEGVTRLSPSRATLEEQAKDWDDDEPYPLWTDMTHAAVHPGGELVACGYQDSQHQIVRLDGRPFASFGPIDSSYPHHAAFSPDGEIAIFNSCHFYNGVTCIGRAADLEALRVPEYTEHSALRTLDQRCRVYDSSFSDGAFLLGDAHGYVRAVKPGGDDAWNHFLGSSIGGIDVSPSGERLAIGTAAGFLSILERDDTPDAAQIGTSPFRERIRYVRWTGQPLMRW